MNSHIDSAAYQAEYTALVQPLVEAPVTAVALTSRHGARTDTLLAVTDAHLHVFSCAFGDGKVVVTDEVARWERDGLRIDTARTRTCDVLLITLGDGTRVEFESIRCYDFNDALWAELLQRARSGEWFGEGLELEILEEAGQAHLAADA